MAILLVLVPEAEHLFFLVFDFDEMEEFFFYSADDVLGPVPAHESEGFSLFVDVGLYVVVQ